MKATAWDNAKEMAQFRSQMKELANKFPFNTPERHRYERIAPAIDDCGQEWGFNTADLYSVGDAAGPTRLDHNPYRDRT